MRRFWLGVLSEKPLPFLQPIAAPSFLDAPAELVSSQGGDLKIDR